MSDRELPADPRLWPEDHYELLGVTRRDDKSAVRRAYTRLIRRYKPEHAPEEFRRIREAYDAITRYLEWFGPEDGPAADAAETPLAETSSPAETASSSTASDSALPRLVPLEVELEAAWALATDGGDSLAAYRRLVELRQRHSGRQEIYARLYWLLLTEPELEPERHAAAWLVEGLRNCGYEWGPLRELYRRVVAENPAEALSKRFAELLGAETRPGWVGAFIEWRWRSAGRLQRWDVIVAELEVWRERWALPERDSWFRLLLMAANELAWADGDFMSTAQHAQVYRKCVVELEHFSGLQPYQFEELRRIDLLNDLSEQIGRDFPNSRLPPEFRKLLVASWNETTETIRDPLSRFVASFNRPAHLLQFLDQIDESHAAACAQFGYVVGGVAGHLELERDSAWPDELLTPLLIEFLAEHQSVENHDLRVKLLEMCVESVASSPQVVRLLGEMPDCPAAWRMAERLTADRTFFIAELAYRIDKAVVASG